MLSKEFLVPNRNKHKKGASSWTLNLLLLAPLRSLILSDDVLAIFYSHFPSEGSKGGILTHLKVRGEKTA